jgi:hypothetical protein
MDGFSLAVLERTVELVVDTFEPEDNPSVAKAVVVIRRYIESPDNQDMASIYNVVTELSDLAHNKRQFLIATRLEAFIRELGTARNHDVA